MLRMSLSIPTAGSTSPMAQHTDWRLPHCASRDTGGKIALRCSRRSFTHWVRDGADVQIFLKAHNERNLAEYEGRMEIGRDLLTDLIRCTKKLESALAKLAPPVAE
jgi:hypothetical protein